MEGITIAHCGDLGCIPSQEVLNAIKGVDFLFVPVGEVYTMELADVKKLIELVNPRIIVPMHYMVGGLSFRLTSLDKFLDMIIQDYKLVESNIVVPQKEYENLINKNKLLESEKRKIEVDLERYKARFTNIKSSDNVTTDNIELVRKINALEKFLWAHGFNPDTIK